MDEAVTQLWEVLCQVGHRLLIQFDDGEVGEGLLEQILGQHAHARTYFQHVGIGCVYRFCNLSGDILIGQEMLI